MPTINRKQIRPKQVEYKVINDKLTEEIYTYIHNKHKRGVKAGQRRGTYKI